jgi:coenzyme F420-0:L-glutamate ligase/coenzyme F420-1:gamma-L-glutamate ligase
MQPITVLPVEGLPLIRAGDNLEKMITDTIPLLDGDILVIASTVYSKARGNTRDLSTIQPGAHAERLAALNGEEPRFVQAVLDASEELILEEPFILSALACGHIGVRAGVDHSNIEDGKVILLPSDPMGAAAEVQEQVQALTGRKVRVIITDTCGRSFRRGQTGHAIGWSGMTAIRDFRGDTDLFGHELAITEEAVIDEIAGFANFVMGESNNGVPVVVVRGCETWSGHDNLYFNRNEDLTRRALTSQATKEQKE